MRKPDHFTCLLRNVYAGQEATVRTGHRTMDWFQIGKAVRQGSILSLCLFNLYAEYIMRSTGLEETQAGIKTARRNINNLRYAIRVVSSAYLKLLRFLLAILIPVCASSSPAFLMMFSAHKLNKQSDNIQP